MDNFNEILKSLEKMKIEELSILYFKIKNIKFREKKKHEEQDRQFEMLLGSIDSLITYGNNNKVDDSDSDSDSEIGSIKASDIQLLDNFSDEDEE